VRNRRRKCNYWSHRLHKLESDLHVFALKFKLSDTMFLEELDQLLQILNIFLFHSFLLYQRPIKARISLKLNQGLRRRGKNLMTCARNSHHIFNADAKLPWQINTRFNCHHHASLKPGGLPGGDAR